MTAKKPYSAPDSEILKTELLMKICDTISKLESEDVEDSGNTFIW